MNTRIFALALAMTFLGVTASAFAADGATSGAQTRATVVKSDVKKGAVHKGITKAPTAAPVKRHTIAK